jgi:hypothetical protein
MAMDQDQRNATERDLKTIPVIKRMLWVAAREGTKRRGVVVLRRCR